MGSITEGEVKQKIDSAFADYLDDRLCRRYRAAP